MIPIGYHGPGAFEAAFDAAVGRGGDRVTRHVFGRSVRGRDLVSITVAATGDTPDANRPVAVVMANIHGNEVVSGELALAVLDDLTAPNPRPVVRALLDIADVTVIPALNVDARIETFESFERGGPFVGTPRRNANQVDLNRNWPWPDGVRDHWLPISGVRTTRLPWSRGAHPRSEPETRALDDLVAARPPFALLNLHSTGQIFTYPWSSKAEPPADLDGFVAMHGAFAAAQREWRYRLKQSRAWYPIIGSSDDHLYGTYGTLAVTIELARPGDGVRDDLRNATNTFWWANPRDPQRHVDNDREACIAALLAAASYRGIR